MTTTRKKQAAKTEGQAEASAHFYIHLREEDAAELWRDRGGAVVEQTIKHMNGEADFGPDSIFLYLPPDITITIEGKVKPLGSRRWRVPTTFYEFERGVICMLGGKPYVLCAKDDPIIWPGVQARNEAAGFKLPPVLKRAIENTDAEMAQAVSAGAYFFHTGQEIDILERSACDGRTGEVWRNETRRRARIYEPKDASHRVELALTDDDYLEDRQGNKVAFLALSALEQLTLRQDADFNFTLLYVASTLAPPSPLPPNLFAGGWIDLNDVMEQIGWYPSKLSLQRRAELRAKVWDYLCFGDRAIVIGKRTTNYHDKATGQDFPTEVASPIWRIMSVESPVQRALFGEVPRRVQIVISKEWEPLLTSARLAQYLPQAQLLGSIAPNKVAGDWARSIGLVLARLWRMKPNETMNTATTTDAEGGQTVVWAPSIRPTRRELLTRYTPKTKAVGQLLDGNDPKRAVKYWRDALAMLAEREFIARKGEASRTVADMLKSYGREGWQDSWLDEPVDIRPGAKMQTPVQERADAKYIAKPKELGAAKKRRGRPKKQN
jgi:hypothetical protein